MLGRKPSSGVTAGAASLLPGLERLEVVAEGTSAPGAVVECASQALRGAKVDPGELEERNLAGRRVFTLRYEAWVEE